MDVGMDGKGRIMNRCEGRIGLPVAVLAWTAGVWLGPAVAADGTAGNSPAAPAAAATAEPGGIPRFETSVMADLPDANAPDAVIFAGAAEPGIRYLKLGELALENADPTQAAEFLKRALGELSKPEDRRRATDLLHQSLLESGRAAEAAGVVDAAASAEYRDHADLLALMKARQMLYVGDIAGARKLLGELAARLSPGGDECCRTLELLARTLNASGDHAEADKVYATLIGIAGGQPMWRLRALSGAALNELDARQPENAEKFLARIEKEVPVDLRDQFRGRLARIALLVAAEKGDWGKVEPEYQALSASAHAPDALLARIAGTMARAQAERKDWGRAAALWQTAFRFGDELFRPVALRGLSESEASGGDPAAAIKTLERYFTLYPAAADFYRLTLFEAGLRAQLGQAEGAEQLYRKVFDGSSDLTERRAAALELAQYARKAGNSQAAIAMFQFVIEHAADAAMRRNAEQQLGEYLYRLGRYQEAAASFAAIAADDNGRDGELGALWSAQAFYQLKDFNRALTYCERLEKSREAAMRRKSEYLKPLLWERLGRTGDAIAGYLDFVKHYPKAEEAATALFQAGELALTSPDYNAADIFRRYATAYPGENAANALYKAQGELLLTGDEAAADALLKQLERDYPESKYTVGAHFRRVDFLREAGRYPVALSVLDDIAKRYGEKNPELQAEIAFDRAVICDQNRDGAGALKALTEIVEKYADKPVAPRAFFMLGDLKARNGEYEAALALFRQAEERQPGGDFAAGCAGRAADAAYGLYATSRQDKYLKQAQTGYETLLKLPALPPALRFQTMYKLGRCLSDGGDSDAAFKLYSELLYQAVLARREGRFCAPVWSAKALNAALDILEQMLHDAEPAAAAECRREAVRLLQLARELALPGEDIDGRIAHWSAGEK